MSFLKQKKILVTGGAGFIGHKLVALLNQKIKDCEIHVSDLLNTQVQNVGPEAARGDFRNLQGIGFNKIFIGDLADPDFVQGLLGNEYDVIFHLGAISDTTFTDQRRLMRVNLESFQFFLDWVAKSGSTLVYASSAAVYGNKTGTLELGNESPLNPYGVSKYLVDKLVQKHIGQKREGRVVGLRYFNVYGPGEEFKYETASVAYQLACSILSGKLPTLFDDSASTFRDFVFIDDVLEANILASENGVSGIYNVGSGTARTFVDVFNLVKGSLKYDGPINWTPNHVSGYQKYTVADLSRTRKELGFSPKFNLENGIGKYLDQLRK